MQTKICIKCKKELPIEQFNKDKGAKDKHRGACRLCELEAGKLYYHTHKEAFRIRDKKYYPKVKKKGFLNRKRLNKYKGFKTCLICHEDTPLVLDCHHLDENKKLSTVSNMLNKFSDIRIREEIKKTVIICGNCHRKHHLGGLKLPDVNLEIYHKDLSTYY